MNDTVLVGEEDGSALQIEPIGHAESSTNHIKVERVKHGDLSLFDKLADHGITLRHEAKEFRDTWGACSHSEHAGKRNRTSGFMESSPIVAGCDYTKRGNRERVCMLRKKKDGSRCLREANGKVKQSSDPSVLVTLEMREEEEGERERTRRGLWHNGGGEERGEKGTQELNSQATRDGSQRGGGGGE